MHSKLLFIFGFLVMTAMIAECLRIRVKRGTEAGFYNIGGRSHGAIYGFQEVPNPYGGNNLHKCIFRSATREMRCTQWKGDFDGHTVTYATQQDARNACSLQVGINGVVRVYWDSDENFSFCASVNDVEDIAG